VSIDAQILHEHCKDHYYFYGSEFVYTLKPTHKWFHLRRHFTLGFAVERTIQ